MSDERAGAGRNLIVCLDGTRNEPETGCTNVVRIFEMAVKDEGQLVYYDPGVGTMGARSATTRAGKFLSRVSGLVLGHGIKDNIEEAYRFLMQSYRPGDRIFVFGFSRGAYTALALTGMLRTIGLLRPHADNLVPYALDLYAQAGKEKKRTGNGEQDRRAVSTPPAGVGTEYPAPGDFWGLRDWFDRTFGNPDFPGRFEPQVHFLGVWDTVKSVGWLNFRAKIQQARWPFTRKVSNVTTGRLALAIDENRRPYGEYRFDREGVAGGRLREMWFAGVHSDVGGFFPDDHRLSDIALQWMAEEAIGAGLRVDAAGFEGHVGASPGAALPDEHCLGKIHHNGPLWFLAGLGWHRRPIEPGDEVHPSVRRRVELTAGTARPYDPKLPSA